MTVARQWDRLVEVAMLGTDRRDPPVPEGVIADVVDDTVRVAPSERMLAQVAATVAIRRAAVLPADPVPALQGPPPDERPPCPPVAVDRWEHVTTSWPVLEDEWMLALISHGWRLAPEMVPAVLMRHRRDPVRRARADLAAGPLAGWLVEHCAELSPSRARGTAPDPTADALGELPPLPILPDLEPLLVAEGAEVGARLAAAIDEAMLVHAHRGVLVNLLARVRTDGLAEVAAALEAVDRMSPGAPLAAVLADLVETRHRMLAELTP